MASELETTDALENVSSQEIFMSTPVRPRTYMQLAPMRLPQLSASVIHDDSADLNTSQVFCIHVSVIYIFNSLFSISATNSSNSLPKYIELIRICKVIFYRVSICLAPRIRGWAHSRFLFSILTARFSNNCFEMLPSVAKQIGHNNNGH